LVRPFGADRLEAAATRAIEIGTLTYSSVRFILDSKLDRQAAAQQSPVNGRAGVSSRYGRMRDLFRESLEGSKVG
jgi:hypothetical protein